MNFDDRDLPFLEERMRIRSEAIQRRQRPPSWLTLDVGEYEDLRQWSRFLSEELEIDPAAQGSLKLLADDSSGWGPFELNRILAHLFKDTASAIGGGQNLSRRSAWLHRACLEAQSAIRNPEE